jgi:hypothetical protein
MAGTTTTLEGLARELAAAAAIAPILVRPAVEAYTKQVLASWKDSYRTIKSKPKISETLGSNVWGAGGVIIGEIGVNKNRRGRGGSFAHILEFGSVNNPARNDGGEALAKAAPGFYAGVTAATAGLMGGQIPAPVLATTTPARFNWDPIAPEGAS